MGADYRYSVGDVIRTPEASYRVEAHLGYGGMGEAYRVTNRNLNDDRIVLKLMHPELGRDPGARENFAREARVGRKIKHDNLARVEWLGVLADDEQTPYFLMEFVEGQTLRQTLKAVAGGRLHVAQALNIAAQMLRGLAALHERGIVHQDMKPSNAMLCRGPFGDLVKLLDLGVMRVLSIDGARRAWSGTPPYSAREQILGEPVGPWTDLFAVAVMIFEMLAGETPYAKYGVSPAGAIARRDVEAPSLARHGSFPPEIVALVAKGLALRSQDRFQEAFEMGNILERTLVKLHSKDPHKATTIPALTGPPRDGAEQAQTIGDAELAAPTGEMDLAEVERRMALARAEVGETAPEDAGAAPASGPAMPFAPTKPSNPIARRSQGQPPHVEGRAPMRKDGEVAGLDATGPIGAAVSLPAAPPRVHHAGASGLDAVTVPPRGTLPPPASDHAVRYLDRDANGIAGLHPAWSPPHPPPARHPAEPWSPPRPAPPPAQHPALPPPARSAPIQPAPPPVESPARRGLAACTTEVDPAPHRGPKGLERAFVWAREHWRAVADARAAARQRAAHDERERARAKEAARRAKIAARVAMRQAKQARRRMSREDRELADKQRLVEENRRRMREAEARGERWDPDAPHTPRAAALSEWRSPLVIGAIVASFTVTLLFVFLIFRGLIDRRTPHTIPEPAQPVRSGP